jgi:hypothetical protein
MYELKLPQPLTTVFVDTEENDSWFTALMETLHKLGYKQFPVQPQDLLTANNIRVLILDSTTKRITPRFLNYIPQNGYTIRQVLKVNNNAVLYDRLSEHADGSLGNTTLSSMHLMD